MKTALMILSMVPKLIDIIMALEDVASKAGIGTEKLKVVKGVLEAAYGDITDAWPAIEKIAYVFVNFCNTVGLFKKSA